VKLFLLLHSIDARILFEAYNLITKTSEKEIQKETGLNRTTTILKELKRGQQIIEYEKKVYIVVVNNATNANRTNNHISPSHSEHKIKIDQFLIARETFRIQSICS